MINQLRQRISGKYGSQGIDTTVPVLILGGKENALSLTRSLAKIGVTVSVSGLTDCWGLYSSFCSKRYLVPKGVQPREYWKGLLLGTNAYLNKQHVILPCCDASIEFLAEHETELRNRHIFDGNTKDQRLALLDKQQTLVQARRAGVSTPKFWPVNRVEKFDGAAIDCQFPVIVKPKNTFKFAKVFGLKFFTVETGVDELEQKVREAHSKGFDITITEQIPGSDENLSSYYTYIDDDGNFLFHFTKRVIRRYPVNCGGATYHATQWLPETAEEGVKFFKETGFRGLGNIEFKRDTRDGKLKVMEVNARFTAAQELAIKAGVPIDIIVYCELTGQTPPSFSSYDEDLRYWYPVKDFLAFLQLKKAGKITIGQWVAELRSQRIVFPLIDSSDRRAYYGATSSLFKKFVARKL